MPCRLRAEEVVTIRVLAEKGANHCQIARAVGRLVARVADGQQADADRAAARTVTVRLVAAHRPFDSSQRSNDATAAPVAPTGRSAWSSSA